MGDTPEEIEKHIKQYKMVFYALLVLTVLTVGVSYIDFGVALGIAVGLLVATVKGSLVLSIFMHLLEEKPIILWTMAFTMLFFFVMIFLILWHDAAIPSL